MVFGLSDLIKIDFKNPQYFPFHFWGLFGFGFFLMLYFQFKYNFDLVYQVPFEYLLFEALFLSVAMNLLFVVLTLVWYGVVYFFRGVESKLGFEDYYVIGVVDTIPISFFIYAVSIEPSNVQFVALLMGLFIGAVLVMLPFLPTKS